MWESYRNEAVQVLAALREGDKLPNRLILKRE